MRMCRELTISLVLTQSCIHNNNNNNKNLYSHMEKKSDKPYEIMYKITLNRHTYIACLVISCDTCMNSISC